VIIGFSASAISRSRHANLASTGVNVFTINEAMKLLVEEGLIARLLAVTSGFGLGVAGWPAGRGLLDCHGQ
jgi:hypothetical protein